MVELHEILDLVALSSGDLKTPPQVRGLVLMTVSKALRQQYGDRASVKCFQSSMGIKYLLEKYGIHSEIWGGDLCVPERISGGGMMVHWGGFWGEDPHTWVRTSKYEIVDLTISWMNDRPIARGKGGYAIPAVWCQDSELPGYMLYLPRGHVKADFEPDDLKDLERFIERCESVEAQIRKNTRLGKLHYEPVITESDDLRVMFESGHHWARVYAEFARVDTELPEYIQNRMRELVAEFRPEREAPNDQA